MTEYDTASAASWLLGYGICRIPGYKRKGHHDAKATRQTKNFAALGEVDCFDASHRLWLSMAPDIGIHGTRIGEIVAGKRSITADTGLCLSRYVGTSEDF